MNSGAKGASGMVVMTKSPKIRELSTRRNSLRAHLTLPSA
jgi:hypothetical protein